MAEDERVVSAHFLSGNFYFTGDVLYRPTGLVGQIELRFFSWGTLYV